MTTAGLDDEKEKNTRYYDVNRFKAVVEGSARPTPTGIQLLLLKAAAGLDSIRGATVTFGAIAIVLAAPVIVIVGIALYGLLGFLASFFGLIGFLGFYVERRLGTSIQVSDYNMKVRIFAQIVGFCIFAAIIIFLAVILPSLGLRLP